MGPHGLCWMGRPCRLDSRADRATYMLDADLKLTCWVMWTGLLCLRACVPAWLLNTCEAHGLLSARMFGARWASSLGVGCLWVRHPWVGAHLGSRSLTPTQVGPKISLPFCLVISPSLWVTIWALSLLTRTNLAHALE